MRKIAAVLFSVLALSLVLIPAPVLAVSLDKDCTFDTVKWENNPLSKRLYLDNWGKTPVIAMSRLAGGAYPGILTNCTIMADVGECYGACAACTSSSTDPICKDVKSCSIKTIAGKAYCAKCWGVSMAFANKSWGGKATTNFIVSKASNLDTHPNHRGNSDLKSAGGGGDWGITGAPHSECKADIWALQCNLDKESACIPVAVKK
jgi:hypothetical protein